MADHPPFTQSPPGSQAEAWPHEPPPTPPQLDQASTSLPAHQEGWNPNLDTEPAPQHWITDASPGASLWSEAGAPLAQGARGEPWADAKAGPTAPARPAPWAPGQAPYPYWHQHPGEHQHPRQQPYPGEQRYPQPQAYPPPEGLARRRRRSWGCGDVAYGILLAMVAGIVFLVPMLVAGMDDKSLAVAAVGTVSTWIGLGGWSLFVSWVKGSGSLKTDFGWAFRWFDVFIGLGLTFGTFVISFVLNVIQQAVGVKAAGNTDFLQEQQRQPVGPGWSYLGLTLMVAVGAPLVEELFFRGLTYSAFQKRFGTAMAVIGSTVIFGLMHFQPGPLVPTLFMVLNLTVFGLVLGLSRMWFKRTGPGVFSHMFFNLTAALVILAGW